MTELDVRNMTCAHCVRVDGRSSVDDLIKALDEAGHPAALAGTPAAATPGKGCCCAHK